MRAELKNARKDSGFTVAEVSSMVEISTSFYYKIESGKRNPTIALAGRIAKILGKRVEQLFFNEAAYEGPDKNPVKKQLRCTISTCFDMQNICCKACDIKKCRYICNYIDKVECEHQEWY